MSTVDKQKQTQDELDGQVSAVLDETPGP
jgi:hypothetical protein